MLGAIVGITGIIIGLLTLLKPDLFARLWRPDGSAKSFADVYGAEKGRKIAVAIGWVFVVGGTVILLFFPHL